MRNVLEIGIPFPSLDDINAGSVTTVERVVPFDCELVGVAAELTQAIAPAVHSFDVLVNGAELATPRDLEMFVGFLGGVVHLDGKVFLSKGDALSFSSNNEQTTADTDCIMAAIVRPG